MEKFVLTISREYGSGGRTVGETFAKELGIPFYDRSIIQMVAEKSGMSAGFVEKSDESISNAFLFNLKYSSYSTLDPSAYYETPITDKVFLAQSAVIKEIAALESCVIVGRCADYILQEEPGLITVFIHASLRDRIIRAVEHYDLPQDKAADKIKKIDKNRASYYKFYTSRQWGSVKNFDLAVNSSFTGIDGAVSIIRTMLREKGIL